MAMVNVNRKVTDQFYRYKMPKLIAKVEGKGNGIKTVIVNMGDIAKSLDRPPAYPTKYFGCELGAQTQIDKKNERYIVNGAHDADKLQELLDGFIEKFVLCPDCDNPETKLTVQVKKEKINQQCIACGYHGQINLVHRLVVFILKNPPGSDPANTPQKGKKSKGKKDSAGSQNGEAESPTSETPDKSFVNGVPARQESYDDDWGDDVSDSAVQERMEKLSSGIKGLVVNQDMEKSQEERMNLFFHFVEKRKDKAESAVKEIKDKAEQLDIEDKAVLVLAEILFTDEMVQQVKKYRILFLKFLHGNQKAQKYLMGAFEILVGKSYPDKLMPKVPHILKAFYDNDFVEEEVFLQWGEKVSKRYVSKEVANTIHEKAKPFIDWLKTAEEESSEEEEDEVEVVYSTKPAPAQEEAKPEEDDINIDDI